MRVPIPKNEGARLRILRRLAILDTPDELRFDRITRLAANLLDVPIALVSLIDQDRQWFKSRVGLDAQETPREHAFCAHAIVDRKTLIVEDARLDPRFANNPLVKGAPNIRFYAGTPLAVGEDQNLGTLCVIDRRPRELAPGQLATLQDLAALVEGELELRIARRDAERRSALLEIAEGVADMGHWLVEGDLVAHISARARSMLRVLDEFDVPLDEALGAFHAEDRAFLAAKLNRARTAGEPYDVRIRLIRGTGEVRTVIAKGAAEFDPITGACIGVFGIFTDVTETERMAMRLQQAEKMATIGTLAAGIGHEINNPLTYIKGNLELLNDELEEIAGGSPSSRASDMLEMVGDMRNGTSRIQRIVHGLRTFSRTAKSKRELIELPRLIESAHRLCANEVQDRAKFVLNANPDTPPVLADESQLVQVLVNLIVNAAHATPIDDERERTIYARCGPTSGGHVFVEVEDEGTGMSEDVQKRVFDPFFTTKPQDVGTGLGLSIVHGIVKSFDGRITIDSTVGVGTKVRFTMPAGDARDMLREVTPDAQPAPKDRSYKIMYVDDDVLVARSLGRMLRGHDVRVETNPRGALDRLIGGEAFDAIICDLMMPEMTGDIFFAHMVEARPELRRRTMFVTGGVFTKRVSEFVKTVDAPVMTKPLDPLEFRDVLEKLIEAQSE